jgi:hypothetical protein
MEKQRDGHLRLLATGPCLTKQRIDHKCLDASALFGRDTTSSISCDIGMCSNGNLNLTRHGSVLARILIPNWVEYRSTFYRKLEACGGSFGDTVDTENGVTEYILSMFNDAVLSNHLTQHIIAKSRKRAEPSRAGVRARRGISESICSDASDSSECFHTALIRRRIICIMLSSKS